MGSLTQRHRVEKASNMLLVRAGVNAERNLVLPEEQLSGRLLYPQQSGVGPCSPPGSSLLRGKRYQVAVGGSPACLPPWRGTYKEETFHYTSDYPSNYKSERGEKQELVVPLGRGVCMGGCRAAVGKVSHVRWGMDRSRL